MSKHSFDKCPCCGAALATHQEPTDDYYEFWGFECRASIVLGPRDMLEANDECRNTLSALARVCDDLNKQAASAPAITEGK